MGVERKGPLPIGLVFVETQYVYVIAECCILHFIFGLISIRVSLIFLYLIKETMLKMGAYTAHSSFLVSSFCAFPRI